MNSGPTACDEQLLRRSLDDNLAGAEEDLLAAHLTDCVECRIKLESLVAHVPDWQRVGEVLRLEAGDQWSRPRVALGHGADATIWFSQTPTDSTFLTDFAVDFLEPANRPEALGRIADIEILEIIGQGGMGIVLKGFQTALNRPVAVKVLAPHLATSGAARQRFAREAQAAAAIVHPNIMPIFTVAASGKLPYLVMPYIDGESLQARIDRCGSLPPVDVLRIGLQVARGLAAAHAQGLVHRDVKPANILLERGIDRVLLTDFGLARAADDASLTRTGFIAGTPQYMSPEQARGDSIDARSDLFSLGSVMYAMCTARPPFRADSSYGILRRITDNEPRPIRDLEPSVPDWLANLVCRLLAKRADARYQSAAGVADVIEQCLAHLQQPSHVPLPSALGAPPPSRRFTVATGMVAAALLLLVFVLGWRDWHSNESDRPSAGETVGTTQRRLSESDPKTESTANEQPEFGETSRWIVSDADLDAQLEAASYGVLDLQKRVDDFWD